MGAYLVTAPYVTLKVKDVSGVTIVQGYYAGGIVQNPVQDEQFEKHVRNGWVENASAPEKAPEPEPPANEPPKGNASRDEWAEYAKGKGASAEETRPVEEGGLKQTELRDKYGN